MYRIILSPVNRGDGCEDSPTLSAYSQLVLTYSLLSLTFLLSVYSISATPIFPSAYLSLLQGYTQVTLDLRSGEHGDDGDDDPSHFVVRRRRFPDQRERRSVR